MPPDSLPEPRSTLSLVFPARRQFKALASDALGRHPTSNKQRIIESPG